MSIRAVISVAAVAALGIAFVSADAFAARVAARGGAVGVRGGAVGVRSGAVGVRGAAIGYRGGALGYRGGLYGGGYYRPGLGLAAGAFVGGALAASQPYGYGGYDYGGYGYDSGYYGYAPGAVGTSPAGRTVGGVVVSGAAGYGYGSYGYAGGCTSDPIMCGGQCWISDNGANYRWGDCPTAKRH